MPVAEKRCPKCGQTKTVRDFWKDVTRGDGLSTQCKVCRGDRQKKYFNETYYPTNRRKLISAVQTRRQAARQEHPNIDS